MAQVTSRFEREGLRKGRQEGRQEGQREERLALVLLFLERRFGTLDTETTEQVRALENNQLLALYTAAIDFTERADLDRWLETAIVQG